METTDRRDPGIEMFTIEQFVAAHRPHRLEVTGILFTGHKVDSVRAIERAYQNDGTYKQDDTYFVVGRKSVVVGRNYGHWRTNERGKIRFCFFGRVAMPAKKMPHGYYHFSHLPAGGIYIAEYCITVPTAQS